MLGESIALVVALLWTSGALFGELASKRLGALPLNVIRMVLSLLMLGTALWFMVGHPYPYLANRQTWIWMMLSGLMGFGFGDYCLFSSYVLIGSRFSQLFMTLASPFAALTAWLLLGERMSALATLGMAITIVGICMSILGKEEKRNIAGASSDSQKDKESSYLLPLTSYLQHLTVKLPLRGFIFGIGAALGQGVGLVLSKVGLEHYSSAVADAAVTPLLMPVGGTMIRTLAGLVCFSFFLIINRKIHRLREAVHDGRGMTYALLTTFLGPALGVSLSLLALQYTQAGIAQTIMSLVPILIIWPSRLIFKTRVTTMEVVGAVIAVLGVTLFFI
ncbi:MAG: DMT family transporter [Bacteroidaceae bacterium]|nr:DMT family transporter [Bacteroidaceae bacterium]